MNHTAIQLELLHCTTIMQMAEIKQKEREEKIMTEKAKEQSNRWHQFIKELKAEAPYLFK